MHDEATIIFTEFFEHQKYMFLFKPLFKIELIKIS
jgi:hypothetical protein